MINEFNIKDFIIKNKIVIIILTSIIIITIILAVLNNNTAKTLENKNIKNQDYIFTVVNKNKNAKCPSVNLKGKTIDKINKEILNIYYDTITNDNNTIDYEYSINDNILSLLIKIDKKENKEDIPNKIFKTYHIDLNNNKVIKNDDILNKFNISNDTVINHITESLKNNYEIEVSEGYIEKNECDFTCYLEIHELSNIIDNIVITTTKDNKLVGYLNYEINTIYFNKDDYFKIPYKYNLK